MQERSREVLLKCLGSARRVEFSLDCAPPWKQAVRNPLHSFEVGLIHSWTSCRLGGTQRAQYPLIKDYTLSIVGSLIRYVP